MFKSDSVAVRLIFNFLFSLGLFYFFRWVGWIQISPEQPLWLVVLIVGLLSVFVGFLMGILILLISPLIIVVTLVTLGCGLLLLGPAAQYFCLLLISKVTGLFTITTVWWQALVIGLAFSWLSISAPSKS